MSASKQLNMPSASALTQADELYLELKPILAEMIDRNDPSVLNLTFNDIEATSAAMGDLLAKMMMIRALQRQGTATPTEELAARQAVLKNVPRKVAKKHKPEELHLTRIPDKPRTIKTMRGEITIKRQYLHFPQLSTGVFPPRDAAGNNV